MIIGHRGGYFGPENSMKSFRGAVQNNLEGIEFDVWISKDGVPMILHGGKDGELNQYGLPDDRVFRWTSGDLQQKIDIGEGEKMPTLEQLIQLCQDSPEMLLNIELKGPISEEWITKYNYDLAALKVVELIEKYEISDKTMISSFVPQILESILRVTENKKQDFIIQSLRNYGNKDDTL